MLPAPAHDVETGTQTRIHDTLTYERPSYRIVCTDERLGALLTPTVAFRLTPEDSPDHAARILSLVDAAHWPVTSGARVVGMIAIRELLAAARLAGPSDRTAGERVFGPQSISALMGPPPRACAPSDSLAIAASRVVAQDLTCLPVVEGGRQVGVLVLADFVRGAISSIEAEKSDSRPHLTVGDLIRDRPVVVIQADDSLAVVDTRMRESGVRHLPVMDGADLIGVVSERDLLQAIRSEVESPWLMHVRRAMGPTPPITTRGSEAAGAGRLLCTQLVGALPVTSPAGIAGILTRGDYLRFLVAHAGPAAARSP